MLDSGFEHAGGRFSVFSYADSALNAHAALNIDWGPGDGTGMQPGRGHRLAIMGDYDNVGLAVVPDELGRDRWSGRWSSPAPTCTRTRARWTTTTASWWAPSGRTSTQNGRYDPGEGFPA